MFCKSRFVPSILIVFEGAVLRRPAMISMPPRHFKSLASTNSATSARLVNQGFLQSGQRMFCRKSFVFCKIRSRDVQNGKLKCQTWHLWS